MSGESPSPSQILFTHEEIVVLKLLFSLFDRGGKVSCYYYSTEHVLASCVDVNVVEESSLASCVEAMERRREEGLVIRRLSLSLHCFSPFIAEFLCFSLRCFYSPDLTSVSRSVHE